MVRVLRITRDHPLYPQEVALREAVLLRPIGYSMARFLKDYPGVEDRFVHFVAVAPQTNGDRVVGCATLLPPENESDRAKGGKLMQMAVDPQRQREGIGHRLVVEVERHAFARLGLNRLYCHAQVAAVPFYEHLGWTIDGEEFTEAGIPHRRMAFQIEAPSNA